MRYFLQFQTKITTINLQKVRNCLFLENYFSDLFTEIQILYWKAFKFGPGPFKDKVNCCQNMNAFDNCSI